MRFTMLVLFLVMGMGCASTQGLDAATRATNALGRTLTVWDVTMAPELKQELHEANTDYPTDEVAYAAAARGPLELYRAFERVRDAQRWLHLAVEQWERGDAGAMWDEVVPCALLELDHVIELLDVKHTELGVLRDTLAAMSDGRACMVHP